MASGMAGVASQRPAQPSRYGSEKAATQRLRAPVASATAPSSGARSATAAPAMAVVAPQIAWPEAGSAATRAAK